MYDFHKTRINQNEHCFTHPLFQRKKRYYNDNFKDILIDTYWQRLNGSYQWIRMAVRILLYKILILSVSSIKHVKIDYSSSRAFHGLLTALYEVCLQRHSRRDINIFVNCNLICGLVETVVEKHREEVRFAGGKNAEFREESG